MSIRVIGLIPAAGKSQRMGRPKLTLSLGKLSVIQRVILSLEQGGADEVLVVAPPVTEASAVVLANHARVEGAHVVHCASPTPDMRSTVEVGLDAMVEHALAPDIILLTPGDVPALSPQTVRTIVNAARLDPSHIAVSVFKGKRGHPVAIPWNLAVELHALPPGVGANELLVVHQDKVREIAVDDEGAILDLDTPEQYQSRRW